MKKLKLLIIGLILAFCLTGCVNKGDYTKTKLLEVETVTKNYIKFIDNNHTYKLNKTWFFDESVILRIKEDKIKEGDILRVKFGYYSWWAEDSILDYEIIKQLK